MSIDFVVLHLLFLVVPHFHFTTMVAHYLLMSILVMVVEFIVVSPIFLEFQQIFSPPHLFH